MPSVNKFKIVYYFIGVIDVILRFAWLLNLSPEIVKKTLRPNMVSLILFSCEIFRRSLWNLIRVEAKHVEMSSNYFISPDIELPYILDEHNHLVVNESNLVSIMGLSKHDTIRYEIRKFFIDQQQMAYEGENYIPYYASEAHEKTKVSMPLKAVLNEYKKKTEANLGGSYEKLYRKLSM